MKKQVLVLFAVIIMIMFSSCDENTDQSDFTWENSQEVIINNIEFRIPKYFDVLSEESTDSYKHFYPEPEDYYCSLVIDVSQIDNLAQEVFDENKVELLSGYMEKYSGEEFEVIKEEEIDIAGMPGCTKTIRKLYDGAFISTASMSVAYDYKKERMIIVILTFDVEDQSDYDYLGDYEKILEFAKCAAMPETYSSMYEKAYMREMSNYTLYYMFDGDTKKVVTFGTNDTFVMEGTYSGSFGNGVIISWDEGWNETFKHSGGNNATLIDADGFDWEYELCEVIKAQKVLDGLK